MISVSTLFLQFVQRAVSFVKVIQSDSDHNDYYLLCPRQTVLRVGRGSVKVKLLVCFNKWFFYCVIDCITLNMRRDRINIIIEEERHFLWGRNFTLMNFSRVNEYPDSDMSQTWVRVGTSFDQVLSYASCVWRPCNVWRWEYWRMSDALPVCLA